MLISKNGIVLKKALLMGRNQEGARRSHGQEIEKEPGKDQARGFLEPATQSDEEVGPFCAQQIAFAAFLEIHNFRNLDFVNLSIL